MHQTMNMSVGTKKQTSLHRFYGVGVPGVPYWAEVPMPAFI